MKATLARGRGGLDSTVYDLPLTVRIDGADRELHAADGRAVIRRNGAHFVEIYPNERLRLIQSADADT